MKRITIVIALLAAMLPILAHAQSDGRDINRADMTVSDSAQFGGVSGNYKLDIPVSGIRGNNLSDDVQASVDFGVSNNPILACSGLDIRDSIKGMFDMSSLADDVKNYLLSLMAKQALSFVYSNPAIAGVLDGLKAFGNARFQLAQTSCEAIEGEVSAESRRLRQQAYETCMETETVAGNRNANFKCATETGSYAQGLNTFVNKQETKINNSIQNWTSRINYGGKGFSQRACESLGDYCTDPSSQSKAEQINTAIPGVTATPGGAPKVTPPQVSPSEVFDEAVENGRHAAAALIGVTRITVAGLYEGNSSDFLRDHARLKADREAEISKDIASNNGIYTVRAGRKYLNREGIENDFVLARSKATLDTANNLQRSMRDDPRYSSFTVSEHLEMENGAGTHSNNSCHYNGSCFDVNCNGYAGGEQACVQEAGTRLPPGCRMSWESKPQGAGYTGSHGHVNCGGLGANPDGSSGGLIASVYTVVKKHAQKVAKAAQELSTGAMNDEARYQKFRDIMKDVPVSDKEVCFYDLDMKGKDQDKKGLEDIRNVTEIFALTAATNRIAQDMDGRDYDENTENTDGPTAAQAVAFSKSLPAKIQQLNLTIGRLALCYLVGNVSVSNMVKTMYLNDADARGYIDSIAQAVAGQAALAVYNGLIYQVQLAAIMANNDTKAPPTISDAFKTAINMLESMRDSIKGSIEAQDNLSARMRSLDAYLARSAAKNAAAAARINSGKSSNIGEGF